MATGTTGADKGAEGEEALSAPAGEADGLSRHLERDVSGEREWAPRAAAGTVRRRASRGKGSGARAAKVPGNGVGLEQRERGGGTGARATGVGEKGRNTTEELREGSSGEVI